MTLDINMALTEFVADALRKGDKNGDRVSDALESSAAVVEGMLAYAHSKNTVMHGPIAGCQAKPSGMNLAQDYYQEIGQAVFMASFRARKKEFPDEPIVIETPTAKNICDILLRKAART